MTSWGALAALATGVVFATTAQASMMQFDFTGSIENFEIETTGSYLITAFGAEGGGTFFGGTVVSSGGRGAQASGTFSLADGDILRILVGGMGDDGGSRGGGGGGGYSGGGGDGDIMSGGGGGSFVADFASNPFTQTGGHTGNGRVLLELLEAAPPTGNDVPEPSSALLFGLALLGLGVGLRRRQARG